MKRHILFLLAAVLGMLNIQPASAQQTQDALYIFRNDGGFNAFFYGDIDHIAYSKVDTLGVEHDDYVTQEIYALDSIFRIPVSAIDSVAFVTPETKYKADVTRYEASISNYIIASDSSSWFRLSASTPSSMIPMKGQKIAIEDRSTFLPQGIGGIVASVENTASGYTVTMAETELSEIFDRVVVKFAAASGGGASARNRAGEPIGFAIEDWPVSEENNIYAIEGSLDAIEAFNQVLNISDDVLGNYATHLKHTVNALRLFFYFDTTHGVSGAEGTFDFFLDQRYDYEEFVRLGGGITARVEIPFGGKKINYVKAKFDCSWGGFFEVSKSGKFTYEHSESHTVTESLGCTINSSGFYPSFFKEVEKLKNETTFSNKEGNFLAQIGFYGKVEAEVLPLANLKYKLGTGIDIGMRIANNDPVGAKDIAAVDLLQTQPFYELLNQDDLAYFAYYAQYKAYMKFGLFTPPTYSPEAKYETFKFGSVPNFLDIAWEGDKKCLWRGDLVSHLDPKRTLMYGVPYGFIVYDNLEQKPVTTWYSQSKFSGGPNRLSSNTLDMFDAGRMYTAYPLTQHHGKELIADKEVMFTLGSPIIDVKDVIELTPSGGVADSEVATNIKDVRFETEDDWFEVTYYPELTKIQLIYKELPDGENLRKGTIKAVGYDSKGNEQAKKTISVVQFRDILKVTPSNLEFYRQGGTKKVTISAVYGEVEVTKGADYTYPLPFEMSLNAAKTELTVTVPENTTGMSRNAAIIVTATTPAGKKIQETVYLSQSTEDESPYYIKFENSNLELEPGENTYELTSECNFFWYKVYFSDTYDVNDDDTHKWFTFKNGPYSTEGDKCFDKWYLTVEKNEWGVDRDGKIELLICDKDSTMTAKTTIYFMQKAGETSDVVFPTEFTGLRVDIVGTCEVSDGTKRTTEPFNSYTYLEDYSIVRHGNTLHITGRTPNTYAQYGADFSHMKEEINFSCEINDLSLDDGWNYYLWGADNFRGSYVTNLNFSLNSTSDDGSYLKYNFSSTDVKDMYWRTYQGLDTSENEIWQKWIAYDGIDVSEFSFAKKEVDTFHNRTKTYEGKSMIISRVDLSFGYIYPKASARKRAAQEKQTTTATEIITRHIER